MVTEDDTEALAAVRSSLGDVRNAVQTAQAMLLEGRAIDLTGMDARIEVACTKALDLPPPLARETLSDLTDLRDRVETLIGSLTHRGAR